MSTNKVRAFATAIGILLLCAVAVAYAKRVPAPVPASAPATEFSAERALRHVQTITTRPHPTGTPTNASVRIYIEDELRLLGLDPAVQSTTGVGTRYAVAGRISNVIARVAGVQPGGPAVLLMAHYDAVPAAPGAGDDASGTATLLETIRALRAGPPLAHDVIALFTDGEETGLLGAAAFVREHPWAKDVAVVLNFEARGTRGPSLMFETGSGNLDVVRVLRGVHGARATSLSTAVYRELPNDTDLSELALLERPAMNFGFISGADRYHSSEDDVAHLDPGSLQHHGNQALALARAFGNGPLPRPRTGDAVFFDLPLVGLIVYPEYFALPFALLACVLVVAVIASGRSAEPRWVRSVGIGALAAVLAVVCAAACGYAVGAALQPLHGAIGSGSPEWSGVYATSIAFLSFGIAALILAYATRWANAMGAQAGGLVLWAVLGLLTTLSAPAVSFLFVWPVMTVAAATLVELRAPVAAASKVLVWLSAALVIFMLVPTVYLMSVTALGVNEGGGAVIGIFVALGVWLLPSLIAALLGKPHWPTLALSLGAAVLLFVIGAVTVRTDRAHPAGTSLIYAVDADSGAAWLTGYAWTASARSALRHALQLAGKPPAQAPPPWLRRSFDASSIIAAPFGPVMAPKATVVSDSSLSTERRIALRILPASTTLSISMSIDSGVVIGAAVDKKPIATDRYRLKPRRWALQYSAPADSGFLLELRLQPGARPVLGLMGQYLGMPPLPGIRMPSPPIGILPIQGGNMSWAYRRLQL